MSLKTVESRVNAFIRIIGIFFIILGGTMFYFTAVTTFIPQLYPIFFFISGLLMVSGLLVVISKLE